MNIKRLLSAAFCLHLGTGLALSQDNMLSDVERANGFSLLFEGTRASLEANFVNYQKNNPNTTALGAGWAVNPVTKIIDCQSGNPGDIRSKKIYGDFDFRVEYRNDVNQGIYYRHLLTGDVAWQTGVEFAIDDADGTSFSSAGSAYGLFPPNPKTYNKYSTGKWNSARIVVKGDSVEHWMNNVKIVGYKYHNDRFWAAYSPSKWGGSNTLTLKVPGNRNGGYIEAGYIGFQGDHNGKWQIKNMKVSETRVCMGEAKAVAVDANCNTVTNLIGLGDRQGNADLLGKAALRRTGSGVALDIAGSSVREAILTTLDGKAIRGTVHGDANEAVFDGRFRSGLYFLRLMTAQGAVTGKIRLL